MVMIIVNGVQLDLGLLVLGRLALGRDRLRCSGVTLNGLNGSGWVKLKGNRLG